VDLGLVLPNSATPGTSSHQQPIETGGGCIEQRRTGSQGSQEGSHHRPDLLQEGFLDGGLGRKDQIAAMLAQLQAEQVRGDLWGMGLAQHSALHRQSSLK
jgi:hypothetical protein